MPRFGAAAIGILLLAAPALAGDDHDWLKAMPSDQRELQDDIWDAWVEASCGEPYNVMTPCAKSGISQDEWNGRVVRVYDLCVRFKDRFGKVAPRGCDNPPVQALGFDAGSQGPVYAPEFTSSYVPTPAATPTTQDLAAEIDNSNWGQRGWIRPCLEYLKYYGCTPKGRCSDGLRHEAQVWPDNASFRAATQARSCN